VAHARCGDVAAKGVGDFPVELDVDNLSQIRYRQVKLFFSKNGVIGALSFIKMETKITALFL
jgi:hypothetical protein